MLIDQIGRHINIPQKPLRIISLVPSQTELLCDMGLEDQIVGITKFCVHPTYLKKEKQIVGGTKEVKLALIQSLKPDIVLCNKEENTKEIVESIAQFTTVHVSDIYTFDDSLELIKQYGILFSVEEKASELRMAIQKENQRFTSFIQNKSLKKVAYFIWRKPWMVAGKNTFINELLKLNNFENVFENQSRYPEICLSDLKEIDIEYILLSSEPFPFKEKHIDEIKLKLPSVKIVLVDGEYFSWYGSRLKHAFDYFKRLHTEIIVE